MKNLSNAAARDWIGNYLEAQKAALDSIPADQVARLIDRFRAALSEDRQIFVFGNGGSAANASHFITDLGKGASDMLGRRFRCLSINDNVSWITALGNDYAYDDVFVRQLENYARPGDFVLVMSVSGNSPNVVKALEAARAAGMATIGLTGEGGGRMAPLCDHLFAVPSASTPAVQQVHLCLYHCFCAGVEAAFADGAA